MTGFTVLSLHTHLSLSNISLKYIHICSNCYLPVISTKLLLSFSFLNRRMLCVLFYVNGEQLCHFRMVS